MPTNEKIRLQQQQQARPIKRIRLIRKYIPGSKKSIYFQRLLQEKTPAKDGRKTLKQLMQRPREATKVRNIRRRGSVLLSHLLSCLQRVLSSLERP